MPSWLWTCGPASSIASRSRIDKSREMRCATSSGVSQSNAPDLPEVRDVVRCEPVDGVLRSSHPRVGTGVRDLVGFRHVIEPLHSDDWFIVAPDCRGAAGRRSLRVGRTNKQWRVTSKHCRIAPGAVQSGLTSYRAFGKGADGNRCILSEKDKLKMPVLGLGAASAAPA